MLYLKLKSQNPLCVPPKGKKRQRRDHNMWSPGLVSFSGKTTFRSKEELDQCLRSLAVKHCNADEQGLNGLDWIEKNIARSGPKNKRQIRWCPFKFKCGCKFRIEVKQVWNDGDDDESQPTTRQKGKSIVWSSFYFTARESTIPHLDHALVTV